MTGEGRVWGQPIHGLTLARWRVMRAVVDYWDEHGFSPSYRDICNALGQAGTNGIKDHLDRLARDSYLTRVRGVSRSIVVTDAGRAALRDFEKDRKKWQTKRSPLK